MKTCFLITSDPRLIGLSGLGEITSRMGIRVEVRTRPTVDPAEETDILVVDARGESREVMGQLVRRRTVHRRRRVVVITDEAASSAQRAALIDAGVLSAVPANPARLAELLAGAIRDALEEQRP